MSRADVEVLPVIYTTRVQSTSFLIGFHTPLHNFKTSLFQHLLQISIFYSRTFIHRWGLWKNSSVTRNPVNFFEIFPRIFFEFFEWGFWICKYQWWMEVKSASNTRFYWEFPFSTDFVSRFRPILWRSALGCVNQEEDVECEQVKVKFRSNVF